MPRGCGNCGQVPEEGETFKHCSRCKLVVYCSTACQRTHWRDGGHKQACVSVKDQHQEQQAVKTVNTVTTGKKGKKGGAAEEPSKAVGSQPAYDNASKPGQNKTSAASDSGRNGTNSTAGGAAAASAAEEEDPQESPRQVTAQVDARGKQLSLHRLRQWL